MRLDLCSQTACSQKRWIYFFKRIEKHAGSLEIRIDNKFVNIEYVCRNISIIYVSLIEKSDLNGKMQSTFGFLASVDEVLQARIEKKK